MSTTTAHDNAEQGKGVLVVHGDGAAAWWSPLPPAVASVRVPVGTGAVVEVDAANPTLVIGWGLQSDGDAAALAQAFGHPQLPDELQILANTGEEVFVKSAPTLTDAWVRRATVAAVAQCTMRPIRQGVLLLDQATAEHAAGRTDIATDMFEMAAPSLLDLGEDCLSGYITGGAATDLAHIAHVAAQSLAGSGWQPDVADLADRLDEEVSISDDLLASVLAMFDQESAATRDLVALDLGSTGAEAALPFFVDPTAVPPRLLTWLGAAHADVLVTPLSDPQRAVVTCALSPATDARAAEVSELFAYAADPALGTVVAVAPMQVDGRNVTATVLCDRDPKLLQFGVFHADIDPATLRLDAVGRLLVEVDRRMLDAYRYHRLSLAAIHKQDVNADLGGAEAKRDTYQGLASFEAMSAAGAIDDFVEKNAVSDETAEMLEKRKAAIAAYQLVLDEPGGVPAVGTTPLLTELLPVEFDSADDEDIDGEG